MKTVFIFLFSFFMLSCMKQYQVQKESVLSVHPVFNDSLSSRYGGYKVNNELISYDKSNIAVKEYLAENLRQIEMLPKLDDISRITDKIENRKTQKYLPIKVVPLDEFGYIRLRDNQVIFYGVMKSTFIDLTNNKVYYK